MHHMIVVTQIRLEQYVLSKLASRKPSCSYFLYHSRSIMSILLSPHDYFFLALSQHENFCDHFALRKKSLISGQV